MRRRPLGAVSAGRGRLSRIAVPARAATLIAGATTDLPGRPVVRVPVNAENVRVQAPSVAVSARDPTVTTLTRGVALGVRSGAVDGRTCRQLRAPMPSTRPEVRTPAAASRRRR
jgi:hypothetical protein